MPNQRLRELASTIWYSRPSISRFPSWVFSLLRGPLCFLFASGMGSGFDGSPGICSGAAFVSRCWIKFARLYSLIFVGLDRICPGRFGHTWLVEVASGKACYLLSSKARSQSVSEADFCAAIDAVIERSSSSGGNG